jgi:phage-related minor tail protein
MNNAAIANAISSACAADASGRHLQHQHRQREHQRDTGERVRPQSAEDEAVVADHDRHRKKPDDVRRGQPEQRGQQRRVQHLPRMR